MSAAGLLVVDKPQGPTSHDIVAQARRLLRTRRVGHAGTLDPMATGVLILLVGEATKLSFLLGGSSKRYRAKVVFGARTDSDDATGQVVDRIELAQGWLRDDTLQRALEFERCRERQLPPALSAIKHGGVPAHRLHRRGDAVPRSAREVHVHSLTVCNRTEQDLDVELWVSKGYYVRSFARDLGEQLAVFAHLGALRRLTSGPFAIDEAIAWPPSEPPRLLPLAQAVQRVLPLVVLSEDAVRRARCGQVIESSQLQMSDASTASASPDAVPLLACLDAKSELVALARWQDEGHLAVVRGFAPVTDCPSER